MKYYLAKTEATEYSIDDLKAKGTDTWDGVANFLAVRYLKAMQTGDMVLIYHSGKDKCIAGLAEVVGESRPDSKNDRSWLRDFKFIKKFDTLVTLKDIKDSHKFDDTKLVRQGRLSTMEVPIELINWLKGKGLEID
jgi:predicted RNA-binding protein with PUA-like domain